MGNAHDMQKGERKMRAAYMSEGDIVANYKMAKYKYRQIGILADLNLCKRKDIIAILEKNGAYIQSRTGKGEGKGCRLSG